MSKNLATLIRTARENKGWSQRELAKAIGVSPGYIGQLESGEIGLPRPERLEKLELYLGIDREDMLRAAGRLAENDELDLAAELRRIQVLPNLEDRVRETKKLPWWMVRTIEDRAIDILRQSGQGRTE